jgi:anti-repressor protein
MKMGQPVCNSRMVAEFFGKRHDNVLRDIDRVTFGGSSELSSLFVESVAHHAKARKMVRSFNMTKDGFSLLAMGFTGPQALQFKLAFIKRFNEMEDALRGDRTE